MPTLLQITEARPALEAKAVTGKPGRFLVQLIDPGKGSSGSYSPEVLEAAGKAKVFPAGTRMYLDHPTESEEYERPERSVRDLAAVLTEDAYWDGSALVAEAAVFGAYRDVLADMAEAIGVSIRASARVTDTPQGRIIEELVEAQSVDFVTKAGRGGKILQILESARPVLEATMRQTEEQLSAAVRDAYGGEKSWTWVRDFDESTVWFQVETPDDCTTYAQGYAMSDGGLSLEGERTEVQQQITYVPVKAAEATTNPEESAMTTSPEGAAAATEAATTTSTTADGTAPTGTTTADGITEAGTTTDSGATTASEAAAETAETTSTTEENHMTENAGAGGAAPLGSPRQVLEARMKAQSDQIAQLVAKDRARDIIGEELAEAWVADSTKARLRSGLIQDLPLVENALDEQALRTRCVEARDAAELEAAETLNAAGVGTPRGLGAMTTSSGGDAAKYGDALKESLKTLGLSESETDIAVKGR